MVLQCDWAVVQVIQLTNDGSGFGFGISGSRNSGAVVRNIFPGGAAEKEGSLQNGDHLLQVGDVRLWGMGAEQVASILRQAGQESIRMVVARPVDPANANPAVNCAIVPTKALADPNELDRALASSLAQNLTGATSLAQMVSLMSGGTALNPQLLPHNPLAAVGSASAAAAALAATVPTTTSAVPPPVTFSGLTTAGCPQVVLNKPTTANSLASSPQAKSPSTSLSNQTACHPPPSTAECVNSLGCKQRTASNSSTISLKPSPPNSPPRSSTSGSNADPGSGDLASSAAAASRPESRSPSGGEAAAAPPDRRQMSGSGNQDRRQMSVSASAGKISPASSVADTLSSAGITTSSCSSLTMPKSISSSSVGPTGGTCCNPTTVSVPSHSRQMSVKSEGGGRLRRKASGGCSGQTRAHPPHSQSDEALQGAKRYRREPQTSRALVATASDDASSQLPPTDQAVNQGRRAPSPGPVAGTGSRPQPVEPTDCHVADTSASRVTSGCDASDSVSVVKKRNSRRGKKNPGSKRNSSCSDNVSVKEFAEPAEKRQIDANTIVGQACINRKEIGLQAILSPMSGGENYHTCRAHCCSTTDSGGSTPTPQFEEEKEIFEAELVKDERGLGLTVAGYICEKESLCGIFVKRVLADSVAERVGNIRPNDQVIEVNGEALSGYTNQEAVDLLKSTGKLVKLKMCRYPGGLKFQQLQDEMSPESYSSLHSRVARHKSSSVSSQEHFNDELSSDNVYSPPGRRHRTSLASQADRNSVYRTKSLMDGGPRRGRHKCGVLNCGGHPGAAGQLSTSRSSRDIVRSSTSGPLGRNTCRLASCSSSEIAAATSRKTVAQRSDDDEEYWHGRHKHLEGVATGIGDDVVSLGRFCYHSKDQLTSSQELNCCLSQHEYCSSCSSCLSSLDQRLAWSQSSLGTAASEECRECAYKRARQLASWCDRCRNRHLACRSCLPNRWECDMCYRLRNDCRSCHSRLRDSSGPATGPASGQEEDASAGRSRRTGHGPEMEEVVSLPDGECAQIASEFDGDDEETREIVIDQSCIVDKMQVERCQVTVKSLENDLQSPVVEFNSIGEDNDKTSHSENSRKWTATPDMEQEVTARECCGAQETRTRECCRLNSLQQNSQSSGPDFPLMEDELWESSLDPTDRGNWADSSCCEDTDIPRDATGHNTDVNSSSFPSSPLSSKENTISRCDAEFSNNSPFGTGQEGLPKPCEAEKPPIVSAENCGKKEEDNPMERKWKAVLGCNYDIIVGRVSRSSGDVGLGISLEGTVDVEEGVEVRPQHFLRSILPEGAVGKLGIFQASDQLLEVNGVALTGLYHQDVIKILKEAGEEVELVCGRKQCSGCVRGTIVSNVNTDNNRRAFNSRKLLSGSLESLLDISDQSGHGSLFKAKSDLSLFVPDALINTRELKRSVSLEPLSTLAVWSKQVEEVVLFKGDQGLGFSILDYQDPVCLSKTVIVVRSLVPGGVALQDGRIFPGDRIVHVNNVLLNHASLDTAVQALKGAARGPVRIGICRPQNIDSIFKQDSKALIQRLPAHNSDLKEPSQLRNTNIAQTNLKESVSKSCLTPSENTSVDSTVPEEADLPAIPDTLNSLALPDTPHIPDTLSLAAIPDTPDLDKCKRYQIVINKLPTQKLGLVLDALAWDLRGCMVSSLLMGSPAHLDGRVGVGDLVLSLNGVDLWRVTSSQVNSILNEAETDTESVRLVYIPEEELILNCESPSLLSDILEQEESGSCGSLCVDLSLDLTVKSAATPEFLLENLPETFIGWEEAEARDGSRIKFGLAETPESPDNLVISEVGRELESGDNQDRLVPNLGEPEEGLAQEPSGPAHTEDEAAVVVTGTPADLLLDGGLLDWEADKVGGLTVLEVDSEEQASDSNNDQPTCLQPTHDNPDLFESGKDIMSNILECSYRDQGVKGKMVGTKYWGQRREVVFNREEGKPLGISIVGGKVEMTGPAGGTLAGIFIKNVVPSSPAGRTGQLATGDRIVQVGNLPLDSSDQDAAVKAIAAAGNPLKLIVQSLKQYKGPEDPRALKSGWTNQEYDPDAKSPSKLIIPDIFFGAPTPNGQGVNGMSSGSSQRSCSSNSERRGMVEHGKAHTSLLSPVDIPLIDDDCHDNPFQDDQLQVWQNDNRSGVSSPEMGCEPNYQYDYTRSGDSPVQLEDLKPGDISSLRSDWSRCSSPGPAELIQSGLSDIERQKIQSRIEAAQHLGKDGDKNKHANDDAIECVLEEDKIIEARMMKRASIGSVDGGAEDDLSDDDDLSEEMMWSKLPGEVIRTKIEPNDYGLGISLAGHRNRETMRTYVCGLHPRGRAFQDGVLKYGDQLLKVGEHVVADRCHLNVTSIIKSYSSQAALEIVVLRPVSPQAEVATKEVTQFPLLLDDMIFESEEFQKFKKKRELRVHKGKHGLGIMIIEGQHKATGKGIFVSDIQEQSAAFHSGLKVGDMILAINTESFLGISYDSAVSVIKSLGGNVKLLITNPKEEEEYQAQGPTEAAAPAPDTKGAAASSAKTPAPAKSPAKKEEKEVPKTPVVEKPKEDKGGKVEIKKEAHGLGISVVGGSDTPLGCLMVHEIFENGPAAKAGSLQQGDLILKINDKETKDLTHDAALDLLRSLQDKVTLEYERSDGGADKNIYQDIEVSLTRKAGKGLGLSLVGRRDGVGVYVSALVGGGIAESSGQIMHGDQIIQVNNVNLEKATQDVAVSVLKGSVGSIKLKLRRLHAISKS